MRTLVMALLLSAAPIAAMAQEPSDSSVYQLGELQVTAHSRTGEEVGGTVITGEDLQTFDKQTISDALDLAPGTNASITGGSRNETVIYVRGFNRFEVPLSVDGVRIFLPLYRVPGVTWLQDRVYRWVAEHRYLLRGVTPWCQEHPEDCPGVAGPASCSL